MTRVLALDVGTSSVRARVYDERGEHVRGVEAQTRYEVTHGHDGRAEFDPDHLVEATTAALEEARREAGDPVEAVGTSCFWHSLMAVDARGRALSPLVTWRDTRSVAAAERLAGLVDPAAVHARTGCVVHPSYWPAKLLWLRETEPQLFRSVHRFVSFADYLYGRLAGDMRTSVSMASGTGLLDVNAGTWDDELLAAVGVTPERLPEISDEPAAAGEPWFPAIGDGACSNVGAGCTTPDRAALMIGTSGAYRVAFQAERAEPRPGLFLYRLDGRSFVEGGALSDGGNLYAWLAQTLRLPEAAGLADAEPAAHGLTFLPLLGGERSPGWNGRARGAIAGLSFDTTPAHILQAALEGIAYRFAELADLLPEVREVVATGHALHANPTWVQILADVLARPVTLCEVDEASARGAAVVVLERLGHAPPQAPSGRAFLPRAERSEAYRLDRDRQRSLYRCVT
ncbi:MAG: gluconokinase [Gaiellaceae bacterium]